MLLFEKKYQMITSFNSISTLQVPHSCYLCHPEYSTRGSFLFSAFSIISLFSLCSDISCRNTLYCHVALVHTVQFSVSSLLPFFFSPESQKQDCLEVLVMRESISSEYISILNVRDRVDWASLTTACQCQHSHNKFLSSERLSMLIAATLNALYS